MKRFVWYIAAFVLLAPLPATAKSLYVNAATGNDSVTWAGNSSSTPWRTLGRAAWGSADRSSPVAAQAAQPGDTVYVAAGTYTAPGSGSRQEPAFNPINSGTAGNPIRFEAQGRVVLQLSSSNGPTIGANQRSHIQWKGFYIHEANAPYHADTGIVTIFNSSNVVIEANEIVGVPTLIADNHNGVRVENSNTVTISNNRIYGVTYSADIQNWNRYSVNAAGIMMYGNNNVTIEHNEIFDSNAGINVKGADNYNVTIRRNLLYGLIHGMTFSFTHPTLGQNRIYGNIIRDGRTGPGIETTGIRIAQNTNHCVFANNTIDNVTNGIYFSEPVTNQSGTTLSFRNNIISYTNTAVNGWEAALPRVFSLDNQNYYNTNQWAFNQVISYTLTNWQSAVSGEASSNTFNPSFVDRSIKNYRLASTSPLRNIGVDVLDLDNDGSATDAVNYGAYVPESVQIGRIVAGSTLESPRGVRLER